MTCELPARRSKLLRHEGGRDVASLHDTNRNAPVYPELGGSSVTIKVRRLRAGATRFERILEDVATDPELSNAEVGFLVRGLMHGHHFNSIDEMADHYVQFDERGNTRKGYGRDAFRSAAKGLMRKRLLTREMVVVDGIPRPEVTFHAEPFETDVRKLPMPDKPSLGTTCDNDDREVQKPRSPVTNVGIAPMSDKPSLGVTCDDATPPLETPSSEGVDVHFAPMPDKPSCAPYTEGFTDVQTTSSGQLAPADSIPVKSVPEEGEDSPNEAVQNEHQQHAESVIDALQWTQRLPTVAQRAEMVRRLAAVLAGGIRTFDEMREHMNGPLVGARSEIGVQMYRLTPEGLPIQGAQVQLPNPRESSEHRSFRNPPPSAYGRPTRPSHESYRNPTDNSGYHEPL